MLLRCPFAKMSRDVEVMRFFPKPLEESESFEMTTRNQGRNLYRLIALLLGVGHLLSQLL